MKGEGIVFQRGWSNGGKIQPYTEGTDSYASLGFSAWYIIADLVPGYNVSSTFIKRNKAMFQAKKGSKTTRLRGTSELLQAGLEVDPIGVARHRARLVEESQQQYTQGIMKRT